MQSRTMRKAMKIKKKYFLDEEFWETISKEKVFDNNEKHVTKEHTYQCTNAKYIGSWKGGFRFGSGTMKWQDGAVYEGEWQWGRAYGKGKFTHSKGEIYNGDWINDKAQGHGVYEHSNGAKYEGIWWLDL